MSFFGRFDFRTKIGKRNKLCSKSGFDKQKLDLDKEAFKAIGSKITDAKKEFRELAESSLKVKQMGKEESDIVPYSFNRDLVRARYVAKIAYKIGV